MECSLKVDSRMNRRSLQLKKQDVLHKSVQLPYVTPLVRHSATVTVNMVETIDLKELQPAVLSVSCLWCVLIGLFV